MKMIQFSAKDVLLSSGVGEEIYVGYKHGLADGYKKLKKEEEMSFRAKEKMAIVKENNFEEILNDVIKNFFPISGHWLSSCFNRPREVQRKYLPCHLRNNRWLSELLYKELIENQGVRIPKDKIFYFISKSEEFQNLRHNYELEIVRWQIEFIKVGGENWVLPRGFSDCDISISEKCDVCFREGVIATLTAIGMNSEVIEEGLEKYAHIWRKYYFNRAFRNKFQPFDCMCDIQLTPVSESHRKNWIDNREYEYYLQHKNSIKSYGELTPAMQMTEEEYCALQLKLKKQNKKRQKEINEWNNMKSYKCDYLFREEDM